MIRIRHKLLPAVPCRTTSALPRGVDEGEVNLWSGLCAQKLVELVQRPSAIPILNIKCCQRINSAVCRVSVASHHGSQNSQSACNSRHEPHLAAKVSHDECKLGRSHLIAAMHPTELLDGLVGFPRQLHRDEISRSLCSLWQSPVSMQTDSSTGCLCDDHDMFLPGLECQLFLYVRTFTALLVTRSGGATVHQSFGSTSQLCHCGWATQGIDQSIQRIQRQI
mmetsp:Transcript_22965/g.52637  ORF Transcript_22965/g.52637 Transcript_22965/m.52637 type:complete len:222 (+) Transcript_22965:1272-1937(+)